MSFIKKIRDKVLENYHSNKSYSFVEWLLAFWFVPLLIWLILSLIKEIFSWENDWWALVILILIIVIICFWMFFKWIIDLFFLSSHNVEENMKELPKKVWSEKPLVQYDLSKEISSSEAGMIVCKKAEISNLLCMIYKRINEKKVDLYIKDGNKYLVSLDDVWKGVPEYESYLFHSIFGYVGKSVRFNKNLLREYKLKVNDMIFEECQCKWYFEKGTIGDYYIVNKDNSKQKVYYLGNSSSIWCLLVFLFLLCFISLFEWKIYFGLSCWFVIFLSICSLRWNKTYEPKLTDKWKKMLSEIVWYKYYLEHCEEEQINSDLAEGEVYSKHLPYAIALKLNWKIIDELS